MIVLLIMCSYVNTPRQCEGWDQTIQYNTLEIMEENIGILLSNFSFIFSIGLIAIFKEFKMHTKVGYRHKQKNKYITNKILTLLN